MFHAEIALMIDVFQLFCLLAEMLIHMFRK